MSFNFYHIKADEFSSYAGGNNGTVITRNNYEEYFVMYVDNELPLAGRLAVEDFVRLNPDLEEELVMLQQSVLRPDERIVYDQKESLLKNINEQESINENNCEEYFVLYGDDELTNEQKDKVEQFVYKHPQYQEGFELIQQVKLVPDKSLTFPHKNWLYRTEEDDNRVIAFPWWRIAAAAIVLITIGGLGWYLYVQDPRPDKTIVKTPSKTEKRNQLPAVVNNNYDSNKAAPDNSVASTENTTRSNQTVPGTVITATPVQQQVAVNKSSKKNILKTSNIPDVVSVTHKKKEEVIPGADDNNFKAKPVIVVVNRTYTPPVVNGRTIDKTINPVMQVAMVTNQENKSEEIKDPGSEEKKELIYVANTSINKTPLRGFFRKVSRVVDKVTNPDENSKGGVRIANLSIALK
jgi:hypothetical protein